MQAGKESLPRPGDHRAPRDRVRRRPWHGGKKNQHNIVVLTWVKNMDVLRR